MKNLFLHYFAKIICSIIAPIKAQEWQIKRTVNEKDVIMVDEPVVSQ